MRLVRIAEATNRAILFDSLIRDLRCISLGMPGERKPADKRRREYQDAAFIIKDKQDVLRERGLSTNKGTYSLMDKIASQDNYKDILKIEKLRKVFRTYNGYYLNIAAQISRR